MLSQTFKRKLSFLCLSVFLASPMVKAKVIEDSKGNQIDIPHQVNRVADLWHANNQIVLLLGGANKLVATTNVINANPWIRAVYPRISEVPALTDGNNIQLEELLATRPDVVLLSNAKMLQEIEKAGLKGVLIGFQDFEGLKKTVQITADVLGDNAPNVAKTYISELESNIQFVTDRLKHVSEAQRPTVAHIASAKNLLKIDGGKSIIGAWIKLAGGKNALPEQANLVDVSLEELIKANPDIIIVGSTDAHLGVEKILSDPTWQSIKAVKEKKVYVNPLGTFAWDRYSAEEALQILWASKLFHPELFKDVDMVSKTQAFYQKYYQYHLTNENAQQILQGLEPLPNKK
ncbi:ABC transporter substrate-binding protein [Actinobacillus minor]|uniref:ABC transporter substrate-binding protein n=2 Tax=Actinobacillus minor TaxID=51047 RepID=UPI003C6C7BA0